MSHWKFWDLDGYMYIYNILSIALPSRRTDPQFGACAGPLSSLSRDPGIYPRTEGGLDAPGLTGRHKSVFNHTQSIRDP